jgi:hypothetical protein
MASAADGWGRANSGRGRSAGARVELGRVGRAGDGRAGERGGWAGFGPAEGEKIFLFLFLFLILFLILFLFLLSCFPLNKYLAIYS